MPYGRDNPVTREKIAERIGQLDAVAGVLVAQLCHDTADMLRATLPLLGDIKAFHSICSDPKYSLTECFVIEIHQDQRYRFENMMNALRTVGGYMVDVERGDTTIPPCGRIEADGSDILFARMLHGGTAMAPLETFRLVSQEMPF